MQLGNLLEMALTLLPPVNFMYRHFVGETKNKIGVKVAEYSEWVTCRGMVQPVQRSKYEALGLDFSKNAISIWGSIPLDTVGMGPQHNQPDQILWHGYIWNIVNANEWNPYNGWVNVTAQQDKRADSQPIPPNG